MKKKILFIFGVLMLALPLIAFTPKVKAAEVADENPTIEATEPAESTDWDNVIKEVTEGFQVAWIAILSLGIPGAVITTWIKTRSNRKSISKMSDIQEATKESIKYNQAMIDHIKAIEQETIETRKALAMVIALSSFDTLKKEKMYELVKDPNLTVEETIVKLKIEGADQIDIKEEVESIFANL